MLDCHETLQAPGSMNIESAKKDILPCFTYRLRPPFLSRATNTAPRIKNEPEASEVRCLPCGWNCPISCARHAKQHFNLQDFLDVHACHTKWTYLKKQARDGTTRSVKTGKPGRSLYALACTVDMYMDISDGNFYSRIYSKMAGDQIQHPVLTSALKLLSLRTPQSLCLEKSHFRK